MHDSETPKKQVKRLMLNELDNGSANGDYYNANNLPVIRSQRSSVDANVHNKQPLMPLLYRARSDQPVVQSLDHQ